jgi:hypothetical protein
MKETFSHRTETTRKCVQPERKTLCDDGRSAADRDKHWLSKHRALGLLIVSLNAFKKRGH